MVQPDGLTSDDRALGMGMLAERLVASPNRPEVRETMDKPTADRIVAAPEAGAPDPSPSTSDHPVAS